jgi:hypothetical protein
MKKIVIVLFTAIILGFLFFGLFQHFVISRSKVGGLQITSDPESNVYIDDELVGKTPLCKCEAGDTLDVGEYTIRLEAINFDDQKYQEKIKISEGVLTVIDRKFSKNSISSGSVISLTPLEDKNKTELLVVSIPSDSQIYLDNNRIGNTPYLYDNPTVSDHSLRISKEGYEEKAVRIRTPSGYKLTAVMYLATGDDKVLDSNSQIINSDDELVDKVTKNVSILDTPTGFLRKSASIGAEEIGRVEPGDLLELLDEQPGWFQIKLEDGTSGWISSQYASK